MKILLIDIETSAHLAYVWGMWQQNVGTNMLISPKEMISWAAKWVGGKTIYYADIFHNKRNYLQSLHKLLDEADVVVHYNGTQFDVPILNMAFVEAGMLPPSPYRQIDLLRVARRKFKFASNKLAYVSQRLGIGSKIKHEGFSLWEKCLKRDPKAWAKMRRYNMQDVRLLERLYRKLLPWITNHPNHGLTGASRNICPSCGSTALQKRGASLTNACRYQRYQCQKCGSWSRSSINEGPRPQQKRMPL
jgi:DNA polymerase elongation subunit (family B)/predicted RNA-binding Zn-ribbon protein involved in translation (DUF1610 family)